MGTVLSLNEKIAASRRASAIDNAWQVAKDLERDLASVNHLTWIQPVHDPKAGIRRTVDLSEYPLPGEGPTPLLPLPMNIAVVAPGNRLTSGEVADVNWTMPLLYRVTPASISLDARVSGNFGFTPSSYRPTIDVVSFLPFPAADASPEEQFKPEFFIHLSVDRKHVSEGTYFGAVVRYKGGVVKQFVDNSGNLLIFADPKHQTLFNAELLATMSAKQLADTPANAGELEVYVVRYQKAATIPQIKSFDITSIYDSSRGLVRGSGSSYDGGSLLSSLKSLPSLHAVPDLPKPYSPVQPSPASKPAVEVGQVSVSKGSGLEKEVAYDTVSLVPDRDFAVQSLKFTLLGVRKGTNVQAYDALRAVDQRYGR
ncbi:hypothetical protein HYY69_01495 [Candidatus Woesearchaeota archaeon]|nr:hypothetical protein [Candidatus Woesearchaeota archaeon]